MLGNSSRIVVALMAGFLMSGTASGAEASRAGLGEKVKNSGLTNAAAKIQHLQELKGKTATVVVFLSFDCPIASGYSELLSDLSKKYADRGVVFLGVVLGEDDPALLTKKAAEFKIPFNLYLDPKQKAALALSARVTPEAFLLDGNMTMLYRGRIDDGYEARLRKKNGTARQDLQIAIDELLAAKPISTPATLAIGCPVPRLTTAKAVSERITYHRDVVPILQNHCQQCHRPGEVGPFSLMTYRQAVNWSDDIKQYTQDRQMPPWKPVDGKPFHGERRLSDKEIATLASWVDNGTPEGNPKDAPAPRTFSDGWQLGKPDLVLEVGADFHLGASGRDLFRCFVLPTNESEDRFVTAVEVRPGAKRVVHHALVYIDTAHQGTQLEQKAKASGKPSDKDRGPGYTSSMGVGFRPTGTLGGWAPGQIGRHLPEGTGYFLPKGADVVVQIHYHRDGRDADDRTKIGLHLAKKPVTRRYQSIVIPGRVLFIPAGRDRFNVSGSVVVQQDCDLHSVMPHMHMIGKEVKITMVPPDGTAQTLVSIKDWDYNWQETYFFKQPIPIKAGTRLEIQAVYDNSEKNPNNPNKPPRLVIFGEQTTNEMLFGFVGATSGQPGRIRFQRYKPEEKKPAAAPAK